MKYQGPDKSVALPSGDISDVANKYKMIGKIIEKCPNLLNPIFNETEKWLEVCNYFTYFGSENDPNKLRFGAESFGQIILRPVFFKPF